MRVTEWKAKNKAKSFKSLIFTCDSIGIVKDSKWNGYSIDKYADGDKYEGLYEND